MPIPSKFEKLIFPIVDRLSFLGDDSNLIKHTTLTTFTCLKGKLLGGQFLEVNPIHFKWIQPKEKNYVYTTCRWPRWS